MKRLFLFRDGRHKWVSVDGTPSCVTLPDYSAYHPVHIKFNRVEVTLGLSLPTCVYVDSGYKGNVIDLILKGIFK